MKDLNLIFQANLNGIAEEIISFYDLKFSREINSLSCPLMRWLDFRFRYIDPVPRRVVFSDVFPKKLPKTVETGFRHLLELIRLGADINPYQSKFLFRHDVSKKRKSERTDLLWADWGVFHFHITDVPIKTGDFFSERKCSDEACWLLFCLVDSSTFALIDIREHSESNVFSNDEMIKIIDSSWPNYMGQFFLSGITPSPNYPNSKEISRLRRAGMNVPVILNGQAYFGPGLGITSAATSGKVVDAACKVRDWIKHISEIASNSTGQIQQHLLEKRIGMPELSLCITPQGLAIFEEMNRPGNLGG